MPSSGMSASVFLFFLFRIQKHQPELCLLMLLCLFLKLSVFLLFNFGVPFQPGVVVRRLFCNLPLGLARIKRLCGPPCPASDRCGLLTRSCVPSTRDFTIKIVKADKARGEPRTGPGPARGMSPFQQGHRHMAHNVILNKHHLTP